MPQKNIRNRFVTQGGTGVLAEQGSDQKVPGWRLGHGSAPARNRVGIGDGTSSSDGWSPVGGDLHVIAHCVWRDQTHAHFKEDEPRYHQENHPYDDPTMIVPGG